MAQLGVDRLQILAFSGMNNSGWTAVVCPLQQARAVRITNSDATNAISVTTDSAVVGAAGTIPANQSAEYRLSDAVGRGWQLGETALFVKGAGTQPSVTWLG